MKNFIFILVFIYSFFLFANSSAAQENAASLESKENNLQTEQPKSVDEPASQSNINNDKKEKMQGQIIKLNGRELFTIYSSLGQFTPTERGAAIVEKLTEIKKQNSFHKEELKIISSALATNITYKNSVLMSVLAQDAQVEGMSVDELARFYLHRISFALESKAENVIINNPNELYNYLIENRYAVVKGISAVVIAIVFFILYYFTSKFFTKLYFAIDARKGTTFKAVSFKENEIISAETLVSFLLLMAKAAKLGVVISFFYVYISVVFILFPSAKSDIFMRLLTGIFLTILTTAITIGILKTVKISIQALQESLPNWKGTLILPLKIKTVNILTEDQTVMILHRVITIVSFFIYVFLLYIFIPIILSFFEFTNTWANTLFGYILTPLKTIASSFVSFLPNLFFILVTIFITRYVIKLVKIIFQEIEAGNISLPNFHEDWADPTFKIIKGLLIVFAAIVVFPYLPGSDSDAFKGVSIFLGVLFSLGSTSVISNIVAGTILTYMYAFRIGDRVKIGETMGDVIEKTLLVTRIKTIKNIVITIPNSIIMNDHIINFTTSSARGEGLILNTTVTIGYDVPWRKVHEVLISAATATTNVKDSPSPFILQTSLDDFYVHYEVNCYTEQPHVMAKTYSELYQNIQDKCNEAGIEILSPHYRAARDGSMITIPEEYLPKDYEAPPFAIKMMRNFSPKK